ncbi:hypothetical protein J4E90_005663 [Alternaria incomplexa]|uniref:uncharacterized protein n=1 Tax=Alternaria incomplexa TaxID=1187928 RepID=UPI00221F3FEC|nr:uncharacterized protein J4E90_005663 [Alternaria incomplexa]KAI4913943.1 hypothetical protein J4E90_005663 [Alternaria incomplexa]
MEHSSAGAMGSDGVQRKYLEDHICHAYDDIQGLPDSSSRIFTRSPGPELQRDRDNRIIIYPGSFNPPHVGHIALLWHAYLNMDANTIAVMIFALGDDLLASKDHVTNNKGKTFILSHYQRRQLWKDDVLGRFAWAFPSHDDDKLDLFMATIKRLAKADGFKVSFLILYGGDYISQKTGVEGLWGGDDNTCIGSDITRPMDFVPDDGVGLLQLEGCDKWKTMKSGSPEWTGKEEQIPDCWPCWPCAKMRKVSPEGVQNHGSFSFTTQQSRDEINCTVPNGDLLCIYLGLDLLWTENGTYEQLIGGKRCEDDLWLEKLRKNQAHENGNKPRRRSSSL